MITPNEARKKTEGLLTWKQVEGHIKRAAELGNHNIAVKMAQTLADQLKGLGYKVTETGVTNQYSVQW